MRDKLIELIVDAKRTDPETGSFTEYLAEHHIANGVTMQEWIPVSERLPDELPEDHPAYTSHIRPSKDVLVKRRDDDHLAVAWYSYGFDDWTDSYEQESFNDVTHWQELPEPPKGE